ncbi:MAG: L,D-transpeptidase [Campylobacterales bacterium]|nr:L,D-transpeptidase [Campylobacterales bacterium]
MLRRLIIFGIVTNLCGNNLDINSIKHEFAQNVLQIGAFKKRYNSYLRKLCHDDIECYKATITQLNSWKQVQEDKKLQNILKQNLLLQSIQNDYWNSIVAKINKTFNLATLKHSQFLSVIDLENQKFILTLWDNDFQKLHFIGQDYISSGNIFRESEIEFGDNHYFKTPSGVFRSKIGWRSDGKLNEDQKTLGYGYKDRYVFYFGKQKSIRYNTFDQNGTKIDNVDNWKLIVDELEFALHSHKSTKSFGEPHSHGCIRVSDELNRFLDNNMVLHKNMLENGTWKAHYTKPPKSPTNIDLAGEYLIIFDSI